MENGSETCTSRFGAPHRFGCGGACTPFRPISLRSSLLRALGDNLEQGWRRLESMFSPVTNWTSNGLSDQLRNSPGQDEQEFDFDGIEGMNPDFWAKLPGISGWLNRGSAWSPC